MFEFNIVNFNDSWTRCFKTEAARDRVKAICGEINQGCIIRLDEPTNICRSQACDEIRGFCENCEKKIFESHRREREFVRNYEKMINCYEKKIVLKMYASSRNTKTK